MIGIIRTPPPIPMMPETIPKGIPHRIKAAILSDGSPVIFGGFAVSILRAPRMTAIPKATVRTLPGKCDAIKAPKNAPMAPAIPKVTPASRALNPSSLCRAGFRRPA